MSSFADRTARRTLPRIIVLQSRMDGAAKVGAQARRRHGRRGRVELFFAFDDAASAVALLDLADRVDGRDVRLLLYPVVARGLQDDPAVEDKRLYAIEDARRLARREGRTLSRTEPLRPETVAFLAEWVAAAPQGPALLRFCTDAVTRLWLESDGPVDRPGYEELWRAHMGSAPPPADPKALHANERRMRRRGPYDTPAAFVHGQWFFAHDRLVQISARLDDLGWEARA